MFKKFISVFLVLTLVLSFAVGCSSNDADKDTGSIDDAVTDEVEPDEPADEPEDAPEANNDEIKVAIEADIVSLDPQGHNDVESMRVSYLVFDTLFKLDEDFRAQPNLVEDWSQPTPLEWDLKIKEGVMFHDGTEMKAEDVAYAIERSKESPVVQHVLEQVEKVEVVDDYTVKVTTKEPFAPFINALVHAGVSIFPKEYAESGDDWKMPIGSGPYKFVEWVSGDKVVLERNDDYFNPAEEGKADKIVFKVIPEGTSRTIALETGEVDIVSILEAMDAPKVEANDNLKLYTKPSTSFSYLGMNTEKAPFDNVLVRQAMNYAIDKESILEIALEGAGVVATSMTADSLLGHVPSDYTYDPEKARELLKEAGHEDGFDMELWASGDRRERIAQVTQANLMDVGINAKIEMYEWGAFLDATNSGDQQMFVLGWSSNPDVDATLTPQFSKNSIGAQNRARYVNDDIERLLAEGRAELDQNKREKVYNEIYEILNEDAPWIPLYVENNITAAHKDLKGVVLNAQGLIDVYKLHY